MRPFADLYARAVRRKGSAEALEALIPQPLAPAVLRRIADDRWLSAMTQCVFQAGFVWRVVEQKWPDFETVLHGFDPHAVAYMADEELERLLADPRIIRHHAKLLSARANAQFVLDLAQAHGSAGDFFADSPPPKFHELLDVLKRRGSRLGGTSGQYFLRRMGVDSWILSESVVAVLVDEGVVAKPPSSRRDLAAVQDAFNGWGDESGRSLTAISRVLAMSID